MPSFTMESWWTDHLSQGDGPNVRTSPLADPNNDTAHLWSRQIDTSQLPWYARALVWATDASHSSWAIEGEDGTYLVEGGCPQCTPQGEGGQLQGSVTRYETVDEAYKAFATDNGTRANVSVYDHGEWSVSASDYKGIVDRFNATATPYNYASTNSNYFANWFGTQAGIGITINPTGSWYMPGPWLYQWDYSNDASRR